MEKVTIRVFETDVVEQMARDKRAAAYLVRKDIEKRLKRQYIRRRSLEIAGTVAFIAALAVAGYLLRGRLEDFAFALAKFVLFFFR